MSRSHIWKSETFIEYLRFLEQEVRLRRRQLGVGLEAGCLIICDCATQHSLLKFQSWKEDWCRRHNVVPWRLLHGAAGTRVRVTFCFLILGVVAAF